MQYNRMRSEARKKAIAEGRILLTAYRLGRDVETDIGCWFDSNISDLFDAAEENEKLWEQHGVTSAKDAEPTKEVSG